MMGWLEGNETHRPRRHLKKASTCHCERSEAIAPYSNNARLLRHLVPRNDNYLAPIDRPVLSLSKGSVRAYIQAVGFVALHPPYAALCPAGKLGLNVRHCSQNSRAFCARAMLLLVGGGLLYRIAGVRIDVEREKRSGKATSAEERSAS